MPINLTANPDAPHVRLVANLWFISRHPDLFQRVNGQTLNALRKRGWVMLTQNAESKTEANVTLEGRDVLNTFNYDAHPSARIIFKGLQERIKKPTKQATTPRQKRETKPKAATPNKRAIEAEIKPLPPSRREAVKEAAEMFISTPGVVVLTPQLINHPDIDPHTLGAIAWCASQTPAPTIEQVAKHLDMTPAFVRLLVKDVANAGFEMRVAL